MDDANDSDMSSGRSLAWSLAAGSWDEVEHHVVAALGDLARRLGGDRSYVTVYYDDGTFRNLFEWTSVDTVPQLPVIQRLRSEDFSFSHGLALRGETWSAPDVAQLPEDAAAERQSFSSFGVRAVLQVPIVLDGVGIGLVGINHFAPVPGWSDDAIAHAAEIGRAIGIALVRDRSADSTRRADESAGDARRARSELLAHVSHELRTPLHGLLGHTELLSLNLRSDADRRSLQSIETSGRRLLSMVDDLIDLAESSNDRVSDVALAPIVDSATDGLAPVARRRQVIIQSDESLQDVTLRGEPGRFRQVVYCAVSGALQAIDDSGTITLGAGRSDDGETTLTLDVCAPRVNMALEAVMPLARTLIEGHGTIETTEQVGGFEVCITFSHRR
jgi:signal transduction histidine kinase